MLAKGAAGTTASPGFSLSCGRVGVRSLRLNHAESSILYGYGSWLMSTAVGLSPDRTCSMVLTKEISCVIGAGTFRCTLMVPSVTANRLAIFASDSCPLSGLLLAPLPSLTLLLLTFLPLPLA